MRHLLAAAALLAALLGLPTAGRAWYVRLTAPVTIEGTTWPAGTYVPVARDADDAWLMRATTTSPRIPKSASELVPRTLEKPPVPRVDIDTDCRSYEAEPKKARPSSSLLDASAIDNPSQPYTTAELMAREGDAFIVRYTPDPRGGQQPWLTRLPLHCISFRRGQHFIPSGVSTPFPVASGSLINDAPFAFTPWMFGMAGVIVALIGARVLIYGRR